jgi:late competence protein required for DNA uptake (superfamily II DNA/RNA helicase)
MILTEEFCKKLLPKNLFEIKRRQVDRLYSKIIRLRDKFTCQRCRHKHTTKSKGLHASHFFSRKREATRFDWDNVDSLCLACHLSWSRDRRDDYLKFKKKQLGFMRYEALAYRAKIKNESIKINERQNIKAFRKELEQNNTLLSSYN